MSMPPAIRVQGLWKEYVVNHAQERHGTFYDLLASGLKAPLRRLRQLGGAAPEAERFWALRDVSFDIAPGEVVGVIGRNGAGKSTLLKILSRITAPTKGRIEVRGRLASLLEVGTGFHPELSGRENIYLNGAILGMTRAEVARKFDEIVAFAEVEKFIDTPVKRYSSGMYVRLAFAVAAHLDVDVLVVDEVLAVGDSAFQDKCMSKMQDVSGMGRTVIFVSHNMAAVSRLCQRGIMLSGGTVAFDGASQNAIINYTRWNGVGQIHDNQGFRGNLTEKVKFNSFCVNEGDEGHNFTFSPAERLAIKIGMTAFEEIRNTYVTLIFKTRGQHVFSIHDSSEPSNLKCGDLVSEFHVPAFVLSPGWYTVGVGIYSKTENKWMYNEEMFSISIAEQSFDSFDPDNMGLLNTAAFGLIGARYSK